MRIRVAVSVIAALILANWCVCDFANISSHQTLKLRNKRQTIDQQMAIYKSTYKNDDQPGVINEPLNQPLRMTVQAQGDDLINRARLLFRLPVPNITSTATTAQNGQRPVSLLSVESNRNSLPSQQPQLNAVVVASSTARPPVRQPAASPFDLSTRYEPCLRTPNRYGSLSRLCNSLRTTQQQTSVEDFAGQESTSAVRRQRSPNFLQMRSGATSTAADEPMLVMPRVFRPQKTLYNSDNSSLMLSPRNNKQHYTESYLIFPGSRLARASQYSNNGAEQKFNTQQYPSVSSSSSAYSMPHNAAAVQYDQQASNKLPHYPQQHQQPQAPMKSYGTPSSSYSAPAVQQYPNSQPMYAPYQQHQPQSSSYSSSYSIIPSGEADRGKTYALVSPQQHQQQAHATISQPNNQHGAVTNTDDIQRTAQRQSNQPNAASSADMLRNNDIQQTRPTLNRTESVLAANPRRPSRQPTAARQPTPATKQQRLTTTTTTTEEPLPLPEAANNIRRSADDDENQPAFIDETTDFVDDENSQFINTEDQQHTEIPSELVSGQTKSSTYDENVALQTARQRPQNVAGLGSQMNVEGFFGAYESGRPTLLSGIGTRFNVDNRRLPNQPRPMTTTVSPARTAHDDFIPQWIENDLLDTPACARKQSGDLTYCDDDLEYPEDLIISAIEDMSDVFELLMDQVDWASTEAQLKVRLQTDADLDALDGVGGGTAARNNNSRITFFPQFRKPVCTSEIRQSVPIFRAMNSEGVWKIIVNTVRCRQTVPVEGCLDMARPPCDAVAQGVASECANKYALTKLIAWNERRGLHIDRFLIPVSCNCLVRQGETSATTSTTTSEAPPTE